MRLAGIDPGYAANAGTAIGVWEALPSGDVYLAAAGLIRTPSQDDTTYKFLQLAQMVSAAIGDVDHVTIEMPRTYGGRARRGDANDIMRLGTLVGMIAATCRSSRPGVGIEIIEPASIPKEITKNRLDGLTDDEKQLIVKAAPASIRHNVYDAVGIGARALRRLHR